MKLVTFCPAAPPRVGLLTDGDRVIDLAAAAGEAAREVGCPPPSS